MQDLDWAFKTALTLKPDCFPNLLSGSRRLTKLKQLTDPQINVPELRADQALFQELQAWLNNSAVQEAH